MTAKKNYTLWRRFTFEKRVFSVSLVSVQRRTQIERRIFYVDKQKPTKLVVEVEPLQETLGDYPAIVNTIKNEIIIIYDQFYLPKIFEGGKFIVEGVKGYIQDSRNDNRTEVVFVGLQELSTKIEPINSL